MENLSFELGKDSNGKQFTFNAEEITRVLINCNAADSQKIISKFSNQLLFKGFNVILFDSNDYSSAVELLNARLFFPYCVLEAGKNLFINLNTITSEEFVGGYKINSLEIARIVKKAFDANSQEKHFHKMEEILKQLESNENREESSYATRTLLLLNLIKKLHSNYYRNDYSCQINDQTLDSSAKLIIAKLPADSELAFLTLKSNISQLQKKGRMFVIINSTQVPPSAIESLNALQIPFAITVSEKLSVQEFQLSLESFDSSIIASTSQFKRRIQI